MGAHPISYKGKEGVRFAVWAPEAKRVAVVGDDIGWDSEGTELEPVGSTGIHIGFIEDMKKGACYKYRITSADDEVLLKSDPYAYYSELRPNTASIVYGLQPDYPWDDQQWFASKQQAPSYHQPLLIYETHAGSWKIKGKEHYFTYEELTDLFIPYVVEWGYTHIEFLPLMEHPLDQSWGYQVTGFYSPTSRYGTPEQLKHFINECHKRGIGVILDWVPGHFCKDAHGLRRVDGSPLYEGADWKRAELPLWGTLSFDYARSEVISFLISNAMYWLEQFHFDGLRVDAVATMLDLHMDKPIELHTLNKDGGNLNTNAITFLRTLNETIFHYYPDTLMLAEDSSSFASVTKPTYMDGLGFNYKWNMGWMNDMLRYMALSPVDRTKHHHLITFSIWYAFTENFVLPLSHDEVVHGKRSLLNKMWGSYEQKFAQLRMFYGYWMTHPGKKLLFMGGEWGQFDEWKDQDMLDWEVLQYDSHQTMHHYVKELNHLYRNQPILWQNDFESNSFQWIDVNNAAQSQISFIRKGEQGMMLIVVNFSEQHYSNYRIGAPRSGIYALILHSNEVKHGGTTMVVQREIHSEHVPMHGQPNSISIELPPFSFMLYSFESGENQVINS